MRITRSVSAWFTGRVNNDVHFDSLLSGADLHRDITMRGQAGVDHDVVHHGWLEAIAFDANRVGARRKVGRGVIAGFSSHGSEGCVRPRICDAYPCAWNNSAIT